MELQQAIPSARKAAPRYGGVVPLPLPEKKTNRTRKSPGNPSLSGGFTPQPFPTQYPQLSSPSPGVSYVPVGPWLMKVKAKLIKTKVFPIPTKVKPITPPHSTHKAQS